ncbi:MAG: hypothetical protein KF773_36995 [Deltaproteobacteria bacterium]|nr:hypothetical protein [Deltaproteobacteria bacterium]
MCATTDNRELYCWGYDNKGQITGGRGVGEDVRCTAPPCSAARPTRGPSEMRTADELSVGFDWTCARDAGEIRCWGRDEGNFLGARPATNGIATVAQLDNAKWKRLTGGHRGSCGISSDGLLACWGDLGGLPQNSALTGELVGLSSIQFGDDARCFAREDHKRVCWGRDTEARLGNGPDGDYPNPTVILVGSEITAIGQGTNHGCAVTVLGNLECWGNNTQGQSGTDPVSASVLHDPTVVRGVNGRELANCTAVASHTEHSCAICDGAAVCWGAHPEAGYTGRGVGNTAARQQAVRIDLDGGHQFVEIATYVRGGCAVDSNGALFCWGDGTYGENGDGGAGSPVPLPVTIMAR